jgi:hypothetical protein
VRSTRVIPSKTSSLRRTSSLAFITEKSTLAAVEDLVVIRDTFYLQSWFINWGTWIYGGENKG